MQFIRKQLEIRMEINLFYNLLLQEEKWKYLQKDQIRELQNE